MEAVVAAQVPGESDDRGDGRRPFFLLFRSPRALSRFPGLPPLPRLTPPRSLPPLPVLPPLRRGRAGGRPLGAKTTGLTPFPKSAARVDAVVPHWVSPRAGKVTHATVALKFADRLDRAVRVHVRPPGRGVGTGATGAAKSARMSEDAVVATVARLDLSRRRDVRDVRVRGCSGGGGGGGDFRLVLLLPEGDGERL